MNKQLLKMLLLASIIAVVSCNKKEEKAAQPESTPMAEQPMTSAAPQETAAPMEKPHITEESYLTLEATVTAINQETREVTLEKADGESISFIASDEVQNLAQVNVGDKLSVEYMEAIEIQVLGPDEAEVGAEGVAGASRADLGEKPAVSETTVVVVIEAIDKENETVTVKGPAGNSNTVKVRNPDNLDKVAIGDKVRVTYTEGLAVKVTEE